MLIVMCSACANFDEAFRDRIGQRAPSIRLACAVLPAVKRIAAPRPVALEASAAPITNGVGPLFDWPAVTSTAITVSVVPEHPNAVLTVDLAALFERAGYRIVTDAHPMVVGFEYLMVESLPARWNQIKGTIRARVAFRVRDGHTVRGAFHGEHAIDVAYFYSSDMETALQVAYCAALAQFARCLECGACLTGEKT